MPALQSYPINFTDPLSGEFLVAPFTSNGSIFPTIFFPLDATAISADTSLLIYGKGHPNYGERIQEDLIHLLENFYGATEPVHAVSGQLWFASVHYWQDTVGSTFYRFDDPTQTWIIITPTTSPTPPPGPIDGDHWFEPGSLTLSIWNADFSAWQPRLYITQTTMPIDGANFPDKQLLVCHNKTTLAPESQSGEGFTSRWKRAGGITVSSVPPAGPQTGDLWFDTTIPQQLKIFDGVSFVSVADRYVLKSGDTMTGFLVLNADPTNSLHAATKQYVDNVVAADIAFTPAGGISSTNVQAAIEELDTSINTPTQTVLNGKVDLSGANTPMTGFLFLSADPMLPLHAATKQYVDTFISGADGTVVSGTLNPALVGADLQLNLSIGGPIFVTGFAEATHGHTATDITFTPVGDISSTNVQAAIEEVDNKNSFARVTRSVITTTVAATYITIPPYFVATNTLWIYLNGIKQIAGQRGSQTVSLSSTSISNPTGLSDEIIGVVSGLAGTGSFDVATDRSALYTTGLSIEVLGSIGNDGTYTVMAPGSTFDFPIVGVVSGLAGTGSFDISGDFTTRFITGYVFTVSGSTGNDGT
ncbi:MAG: hypothetical protein ACREAU_01280, partial [Nitrosopumilaceae archaeon]